MTSQGLEIIDRPECEILLRGRTLGRVGVKIADELVILPVFYAVVDGDIVFRTAPGTKLDAAVLGTSVAFEVDGDRPRLERPRRGSCPRAQRPGGAAARPYPPRARLARRRA